MRVCAYEDNVGNTVTKLQATNTAKNMTTYLYRKDWGSQYQCNPQEACQEGSNKNKSWQEQSATWSDKLQILIRLKVCLRDPTPVGTSIIPQDMRFVKWHVKKGDDCHEPHSQIPITHYPIAVNTPFGGIHIAAARHLQQASAHVIANHKCIHAHMVSA